MLLLATIVIMAAVAWAHYRNGLFAAVIMLMMVLISGLFAFGFWEPLADALDTATQQNLKALAGTEDMIALSFLFCVPFALMRWGFTHLVPEMIEEQGAIQHFGGAAVGLITGYFLAGFLVCMVETLPLEQNFLDFEPRSSSETGYRNIVPPDRVWLALMRYASGGAFRWKDDPDADGVRTPLLFDRDGTFEMRYMRYRRSSEGRPPLRYFGEFDRELGREKRK
jgi:hypothetical protein